MDELDLTRDKKDMAQWLYRGATTLVVALIIYMAGLSVDTQRRLYLLEQRANRSVTQIQMATLEARLLQEIGRLPPDEWRARVQALERCVRRLQTNRQCD